MAPKDKLEGDALPISQQAYIYRTNLDASESLDLTLKSKHNGVYVFVVDGEVKVGEHSLLKRDAIGVYETDNFSINSNKNSELIVIEVPMK